MSHIDLASERLLAGLRLAVVVTLTAILGLRGSLEHDHELMISLVGLALIAALSLSLAYYRFFRWWVPWLFATLDVTLLIHCLTLFAVDLRQPYFTALAVPGTSLIFVYLATAAIRYRPFLVLYTGTLFISSWLLVWLRAPPSQALVTVADNMWSAGEVARIAIVALVTAALFLAASRAHKLVITLVSEVQLRGKLSQYLPPPVTDALANGEDILRARHQQVAVLLVDIRGFTRMAETMSPGGVADLLTSYRQRLSRRVADHEGFVDKFIGDGLTAVFGAPRPGAHDARNALACAFSIIAEIGAWNRKRATRGKQTIDVVVAIHFGEVIAGALGEDTRLEYTVIGDTVNVAARIEELAGELGAARVVSEELLTAAHVTPDASTWKPLQGQALRGRRQPINIFCFDAVSDHPSARAARVPGSDPSSTGKARKKLEPNTIAGVDG